MAIEIGTILKALLALGALVALFLVVRARRRRRDEKETETSPWAAPDAQKVASAAVADAELETLRKSGGNAEVRIQGDFHARGVVKLPAAVVVRGALIVEEGAEMDGLVEVFGNVTVGERARLTRPILVHGDMTLGKDARAPSCHVDGAVALASGAAIEGSLHCGVLYIEDAPREPAALTPRPLAEPMVSVET